MAEEITCLVHSRKDFEFAVRASAILFSNDTAQTLKELNEDQLLQVMEGVPSIEIEKKLLSDEIDLISLLTTKQKFFQVKVKPGKWSRRRCFY